MSTPHILPRQAHLLSKTKPQTKSCRSRYHPRRTFLTLPTSTPQLLTAARRLPYPQAALYDLIADIDSYRQFLPYCTVSRVTQWTAPSPNPLASPTSNSNSSGSGSSSSTTETHRRWPTRADLTAGWGGFSETYTSRVYCIPAHGIVEAVSGAAQSSIPVSELRKHGLLPHSPSPSPSPPPFPSRSGLEKEKFDADREQEDEAQAEAEAQGGVFESLVTRWTVTPATETTRADRLQHDWSDVRLSIRYRFASPLYAAVSSAVADKVAPVMVEAFVERARWVLGETGRAVEVLP
ncbi:hypothetical protein GGR54DRAFT_597501 [Hypoxylon sp. NC1633]|nr:hypothetical protein GGR54DRAFT_597501 [Hypoxylon sp. NC1633]